MFLIEKIIYGVNKFDTNLSEIIIHFLKNYVPSNNPPVIAAHFVDFFKIIFYSLLSIIPFLFLKIIHPYNRFISAIIILILGIIGLLTFAIALGLIQLTFTF